MTVGELRKALEPYDGDAPVLISKRGSHNVYKIKAWGGEYKRGFFIHFGSSHDDEIIALVAQLLDAHAQKRQNER